MDAAQSPDNDQAQAATPAQSTPPAAVSTEQSSPATSTTPATPQDSAQSTTSPVGTPPPGTPTAKSPLANKKFLFIIIGIGAFLLLLIIIGIAASAKSAKQAQQQQQQQDQNNISAITPTKAPTPTINPLPTQNLSPEVSIIKTQAKPQIDAKVNGTPYTIAFVKLYSPTWAIAEITNPTTDPANIVLKKVNNYWNVVLGPGTFFDDDTLNTLGAPDQLVKDANTVFVQPGSVSPSAGE